MRYISPEFRTMLDVFSACDGGGRLVTFQAKYDQLVIEAAEGNADSAALLLIFHRAAKMVELMSKES